MYLKEPTGRSLSIYYARIPFLQLARVDKLSTTGKKHIHASLIKTQSCIKAWADLWTTLKVILYVTDFHQAYR